MLELMVSIRRLERLLEPYSVHWGASSEFTEVTVYEKDGVSVRVDGLDIQPFGEIPTYKQALENAA